MTSTPHRLSGGAASTEVLRRQARYWNARYLSDPALFGTERSPFLEWVFSSLKGRRVGRTWVELGSGYGRDLRELRARGYSAHGVDVSHFATTLARESGLEVVCEPADRFLSRWEEASVDVVFSNFFLNMEFSQADHEQLFAGIHRALAPGGYHAYSVRTVSDRWYGKGVLVGPDTFDLAPDGPVMHFFSREYARRLRGGRFRNVRAKDGTEDPGGFATRVLYVVDQKRPTGRH